MVHGHLNRLKILKVIKIKSSSLFQFWKLHQKALDKTRTPVTITSNGIRYDKDIKLSYLSQTNSNHIIERPVRNESRKNDHP